MEGRRSYSINNFIESGPGISAQKANLTKAIRHEDLLSITRSSVKLLAQDRNLAKIFLYSEILIDKVKSQFKSLDLFTFKEICIIVGIYWGHYKKSNDIESDKIIDDAVSCYVSKFLRETGNTGISKNDKFILIRIILFEELIAIIYAPEYKNVRPLLTRTDINKIEKYLDEIASFTTKYILAKYPEKTSITNQHFQESLSLIAAILASIDDRKKRFKKEGEILLHNFTN